MATSFGSWLYRYNGDITRIRLLKQAFDQRRAAQGWAPRHFRDAASVYTLLATGNYLPPWSAEVLLQCEKCWKAGNYELPGSVVADSFLRGRSGLS